MTSPDSELNRWPALLGDLREVKSWRPQDLVGQSLEGLDAAVRASAFPMILVDRTHVVVAASASSGFVCGKTCLEQAAPDERRYLYAFSEELKKQDFWSASEAWPIHYAFFRGLEIAGALLVPVVVGGEVFAVVQKREPVALTP